MYGLVLFSGAILGYSGWSLQPVECNFRREDCYQSVFWYLDPAQQNCAEPTGGAASPTVNYITMANCRKVTATRSGMSGL